MVDFFISNRKMGSQLRYTEIESQSSKVIITGQKNLKNQVNEQSSWVSFAPPFNLHEVCYMFTCNRQSDYAGSSPSFTIPPSLSTNSLTYYRNTSFPASLGNVENSSSLTLALLGFILDSPWWGIIAVCCTYPLPGPSAPCK